MNAMIENIKNRKYRKKKRINRSRAGDIALFTILILFGAFSAFPLIMTASNAFKPLDELFLFPPRLLPRNVTFDNFRDLSELMSNSWIPFTRYFFNTILITVLGTFGLIS